jgi:hypothetical protein
MKTTVKRKEPIQPHELHMLILPFFVVALILAIPLYFFLNYMLEEQIEVCDKCKKRLVVR